MTSASRGRAASRRRARASWATSNSGVAAIESATEIVRSASHSRESTPATRAEAKTLATQAASATEGVARDRLLDHRRSLLQGLIEIYAPRPHVADAVDKAKALLDGP